MSNWDYMQEMGARSEFGDLHFRWFRQLSAFECHCDPKTQMGGKPGYLYVLRAPEGYKIGASREGGTGYLSVNFDKRSMASLKRRIKCHREKSDIEFCFSLYTKCPFCLERQLHDYFDLRRVINCRWPHEVFDLTPIELRFIASITEFAGQLTEWHGSLIPNGMALMDARRRTGWMEYEKWLHL